MKLATEYSQWITEVKENPYIGDFLRLTDGYKERDIANQLIQDISRFLLELGSGRRIEELRF